MKHDELLGCHWKIYSKFRSKNINLIFCGIRTLDDAFINLDLMDLFSSFQRKKNPASDVCSELAELPQHAVCGVLDYFCHTYILEALSLIFIIFNLNAG